MAHTSYFAENFEYGRELIHAGIDGIKAGERLTLQSPDVHLARSAQRSLVAAAIGGTVAVIACRLTDSRRRLFGKMIAFGTAAFCADFIWRTRTVSSTLMQCAEREITKVRDQHWLASNPIDYA